MDMIELSHVIYLEVGKSFSTMGTVILEKIEEKRNSVDLVERERRSPLAEKKRGDKDVSSLENRCMRATEKMTDFIKRSACSGSMHTWLAAPPGLR